MRMAAALAEDPTVYQYDEVYDKIEEKKQERVKLLEEKKKQQESKKQAKSKKQQATKGKARQAGRQSKKEGWMDVGEEGTSLDAMVRNCLLPTSRLTVLQVLKTEIPFR